MRWTNQRYSCCLYSYFCTIRSSSAKRDSRALLVRAGSTNTLLLLEKSAQEGGGWPFWVCSVAVMSTKSGAMMIQSQKVGLLDLMSGRVTGSRCLRSDEGQLWELGMRYLGDLTLLDILLLLSQGKSNSLRFNSIIHFHQTHLPFKTFLSALWPNNIFDIHQEKAFMSTIFFERNQPNIQREIEKSCQICSKEFSFRRRQHQCKRCLRAVCSDCSSQKIQVFKLGFIKRPHRGCKICFEEIKVITEYIESNHLQFGKMSHFGNKWMSRIEKRSLNASIDNRKHKKFTREVFARMWDSYNYSLREFIGLLTFQYDQDQIYQMVNDVFISVISIAPEEDIENVAYLVVFILCFCTPDKAPIICLYLFELKATVANEQGLNQALFRALGISEGTQEKMKDYIRSRAKRFISTFSVNCLGVKASFEILQKIITKRKIDEIYIYFSLCIELLKDTIQANKENPLICDLILVRNCSFDAINNKYKTASSVKTLPFMQKREQYQEEHMNMSVNRSIENSFTQQNPMIASFSEGIRGNNGKQTLVFNPNERQQLQRNNEPTFKKREVKEESFYQDSFSVINMIDDLNQAPQRNGRHFEITENQLLNLMTQVDQKSPNTSQQIKQQTRFMSDKSIVFPQNVDIEYGPPSEKNKKPVYCDKCTSSNAIISKLTKEIETLRQQKTRSEEQYKKEIQLLQERVNSKPLTATTNTKQNQTFSLEKLEYETQIRKLRQAVADAELRQKQLNASLQNSQNQKRTLKKKQEEQLRVYQKQIQQSNSNIKMLKNKIENQSYSMPQQRSNPDNSDKEKIIERLKTSLKEKNQEIEDLTKRNKLIVYQLEAISKQRENDKEKSQLKAKIEKLQLEKVDLLDKFKELSTHLMQEQSQKLAVCEQNFQIKQLLRQNNIKYYRD